ncbi:hypothetical protein Y032_0039g147 [Ancylostoma ceylanicum]|nr:hypothetical protein Y032_0039g147 [Ancylostoma ceylanicum]
MYPAVQTYLDLDHEAPNFTALGCVILINAGSIGSVSQFNFTTRSYSPVSKGLNILLNGLENSPHIVKRKFPQHFWPTFKWGRKGYMQTRWKVNNRTLDFVNVHLFHDESNLALIHENPFLYSSNRKRALDYVLEQLMASGNWESSPCFIFGDLNFRLDSTSFLNNVVYDILRSILLSQFDCFFKAERDDNTAVKINCSQRKTPRKSLVSAPYAIYLGASAEEEIRVCRPHHSREIRRTVALSILETAPCRKSRAIASLVALVRALLEIKSF